MARPFQSIDQTLVRQLANSQYGGKATREPRLSLPKHGSDPGALGSMPFSGMDVHSMLSALLKHPVLGPALLMLLLGNGAMR